MKKIKILNNELPGTEDPLEDPETTQQSTNSSSREQEEFFSTEGIEEESCRHRKTPQPIEESSH